MSSESYKRRPSDEIENSQEDSGKPQLTQTVSNAYTISPELFEKLYLTPKVNHLGSNVKRYANPTPMGFLGFIISDITFSMCLMGFGGADNQDALAGMFMFTGPVLLLIATVCEWIMGNFFSMMASSMFAVFWLSFSLLKLPTLQLANAYSTTGNEAEGSASVEYNAAIGLYLVVWGAAFFMFWIFTTRINVAICSMFTCATSGIWTLSAAYFKVAAGDYVTAGHLQKAGGALVFGAGVFGWYITFVIMSAEMGVFKNLPVGDLSHFWAKTDIEKGIREE